MELAQASAMAVLTEPDATPTLSDSIAETKGGVESTIGSKCGTFSGNVLKAHMVAYSSRTSTDAVQHGGDVVDSWSMGPPIDTVAQYSRHGSSAQLSKTVVTSTVQSGVDTDFEVWESEV